MIAINATELACASGFTSGTGNPGPFTLTHSSQSVFHIICGFNHYGTIASYGCARKGFVANGPAGISLYFEDNYSTSNGGEWEYTKLSNTSFTIEKTSGSYSGTGYWFIEIVGNHLISFV